MNLAPGNTVVALARNAEAVVDSVVADDDGVVEDDVVETDEAVEFNDLPDSDNESGDTDV
jgi:hypothetical protein